MNHYFELDVYKEEELIDYRKFDTYEECLKLSKKFKKKSDKMVIDEWVDEVIINSTDL